MPQLILYSQQGKQTIELGFLTTIGRARESNICLKEGDISRHHAEISFGQSGYLYKDLNSRNGSFSLGLRIKEKNLDHGDKIQLGTNVKLIFVDTDSNKSPSKLVHIASTPLSKSAIQDRMKIGLEPAFTPAHKITDDMDWRDDYEKLRLGNELLQHVELQQDLDEILESISGKLLEMFPADRCAILLLDSQSDQLVPMTLKAKPGIDGNISISQSILDEVRKTHSSLFIADVSIDDRFSQSSSIRAQGLHSVLCAPIIHDNAFYGAIHLDSQKSAMVFTRKDLHLITSLVAHVATLIANAKLMQSVEKDAKEKAQLERLLPPSVMEKITKGELIVDKKAGELKEVTILFADIRGFTNMAHNASAIHIVEMLNEYFELIVNVVFQYGGTVDKFIGDEVMVLFDALTDVRDPEDRAVQCAFFMHGTLELFNLQRKAEGKKVIEVGIGINTGKVVVGAIGSNQAMQYTCIGDAVNIASRLTNVAKAKQTIISEETFNKLKHKPKHSKLPPISLKGIDRPIQLYSVWEEISDTTAAGPPRL